MLRKLGYAAVALVLVGCCADVLFAQGGWPEMPLDSEDPHGIPRGPGGYFSWIKLLSVFLMYLLWIKTTDWVNNDCQILDISYTVWNMVVYAPFVAGMILVVTIPIFPVGLAVLVLSHLVPLFIYIFKRNAIVDPHERVMTPAHLRFLLSNQAKKAGVGFAGEKKAAHEKGSPVLFEARGGTDQQNQSNIIAARQSTGYLSAKDLVADLIRQRGDKCMLDYSRDAVAVRFQIDGVWHESEGQERDAGDEMLSVFKMMGNLSVKERRKRQSGRFLAAFEKNEYNCHLISQGTQSGERVILQVDRPKLPFSSLRELGLREKTEQKLKELITVDNGIVLFSSPPSGGLTTTVSLALGLTDRYMYDFVAMQDVTAPEPLAENIECKTYDLKKGEKPERVLESMLRKEPHGVVVNELPNVETIQMLCQHAANDKVVITTIRAKEAVEALLRVLLLKVPAASFAPAVQGVLNQRLIRRLCEECKQSYEPEPQLVKKLGIPAGRIDHLYRPPDSAEQDKVCQHCNGIGYFGRTAIFELLWVDDKIRQALAKQPKLDILRKISRQAGNRSLQQEGIVLIAQGVTSVQELSRVLKQ